MNKFINLIKAHKIISGIVLVVIIFSGYQWYKKNHSAAAKVQYVTEAASKKTITVSITGTGQVSAQNKIDLKPGGSGQSAAQLISVNVKPSDQVKAGQVIATVDEKNNNVALIQAHASLSSASASYDKLVAGLTGTDLATAQLSVTTAQQALDKAKSDYNSTVITQQQAVDKALSNLLNSGLVAIPSDNNSTVTATVNGSYTGKTEGSYQIKTSQTPSGLRYQTLGLGSGNGIIQLAVPLSLGSGLYVTFSSTGNFDPSTSWTIDVPNKSSSSYLTNNFAYQSALQSQSQALASAQNTINTSQNSLTAAQLSLQSKTDPPNTADVAQARAQIAQAQAQLATAEVNYDNNIIKSPFDGQVAAVNNQPGDQVTSSTVIATVITNQKLAVLSLNEVDVAKVKTGQKANLTFDALNGLNVAGSVAEVDAIGAVSQGVVSYTVKIGFDSQDDRIKAGMSVSAAIITDVKTDVLSVPSTAVKSNNTGSYVQILDDKGQPQNKTVQVGISNDTDTEITSGLNDGDVVVSQIITSSSTTTTTTTNRTGTGGILPGGGFGGGGAARFRGGN
jgi:HlyD family secretion protein